MVAVADVGRAQVVDRTPRTDTLSFADRLSVRANFVDWTFMLPNVEVEFNLGDKNWSRWAVGLGLTGNWQTSHTFKPGVVYNLMEVKADLRYYWRPRLIGTRGVTKQTGLLDRLFSCRRDVVKRPSMVFYRGAYIAYSDYSFKFGSEGNQGSAITLGVSWGAVRPLYVFRRGNSLDLELGVGVGLCYRRNDKYRHDREDDCYPITEKGSWGIVPFPVVSDIRVGLIYRLGKYPSTSMYRWRYDVDAAYAALNDSINEAREVERINKHTSDSITKLIDTEFWRVYNAAAGRNKAKADSLDRADSKRRELQKAAEKAARKQRKETEKQADSASVALPKDSITAAPQADSVQIDSTAAPLPIAASAVTDSTAAAPQADSVQIDSTAAPLPIAASAATDSTAAAPQAVTVAADSTAAPAASQPTEAVGQADGGNGNNEGASGNEGKPSGKESGKSNGSGGEAPSAAESEGKEDGDEAQ